MLGLLARFGLEQLVPLSLTPGQNKSCGAAETPVDHAHAKVKRSKRSRFLQLSLSPSRP
jgi:hypothetical protein